MWQAPLPGCHAAPACACCARIQLAGVRSALTTPATHEAIVAGEGAVQVARGRGVGQPHGAVGRGGDAHGARLRRVRGERAGGAREAVRLPLWVRAARLGRAAAARCARAAAHDPGAPPPGRRAALSSRQSRISATMCFACGCLGPNHRRGAAAARSAVRFLARPAALRPRLPAAARQGTTEVPRAAFSPSPRPLPRHSRARGRERAGWCGRTAAWLLTGGLGSWASSLAAVTVSGAAGPKGVQIGKPGSRAPSVRTIQLPTRPRRTRGSMPSVALALNRAAGARRWSSQRKRRGAACENSAAHAAQGDQQRCGPSAPAWLFQLAGDAA